VNHLASTNTFVKYQPTNNWFASHRKYILDPPGWGKLGGIKGLAVEQVLGQCFQYLLVVWGGPH